MSSGDPLGAVPIPTGRASEPVPSAPSTPSTNWNAQPIQGGGDDVLLHIRNRFANPEHSKVPLESTTADDAGIRKMMVGGGWKALLRLSTNLVVSSKLPHLKLRYTAIKLVCMMKLIVRNHALLQHALNVLAEVGGPAAKENQFESYPDLYPGRTGSMLPFMIRLLDCEANYILSKDLTFFFTLHSECVQTAKALKKDAEHLAQVLVNVERVFEIGSLHPEESESLFHDLDETKAEVWYQRADEIAFSILTRQIQAREPLLGLQTISQLLPHYLENSHMLAIIIRLYVLLGDVKAAQKALNKLEKIAGADSQIAIIHHGIWLISQAEYQKALDKFEIVMKIDPYHMTAVNNAAICLTFLRNAQRALSLLEDALFTKPHINLNETSVFNLCTLYELLSDRALDRRRKVLQLVLDHAPDHFNLLCLRLPPGSLAPTNHPPIQP